MAKGDSMIGSGYVAPTHTYPKPEQRTQRLLIEGIDLGVGIADRPDLYCIALVEHGEVLFVQDRRKRGCYASMAR